MKKILTIGILSFGMGSTAFGMAREAEGSGASFLMLQRQADQVASPLPDPVSTGTFRLDTGVQTLPRTVHVPVVSDSPYPPGLIFRHEETALSVRGIERWIKTLLPATPLIKKSDVMVLMQDPRTGAVFAIRRVR